jgi:hypothetical protein
MPSEITVSHVSAIPSTDPKRRGEATTWVVYQIKDTASPTGLTRTASVAIPKASPTEAEIKAAITAAEKERSGIIGKKFTL